MAPVEDLWEDASGRLLGLAVGYAGSSLEAEEVVL